MKIHALLRTGAALISLLAPAAVAATWTVVDTVDDLPPATPTIGSLRWAIQNANTDNNPPVTIDFAVPPPLLTPPVAGGVVVIRPQSPLPIIQNTWGHGIMINGYSQPGASVTAFNPSSIVVRVELDGSLLPPAGSAPPYLHGLHIRSSGNTVQGLCVHSFPHDGISIQGIPANTYGHPGSNANLIQWNLVGTDINGLVPMPNGHDGSWPGGGGLWGGIYIKVLPGAPGLANDNTVLENVSSGNAVEGIGIANCPDEGSEVKRNHVERNYVGIDITGTGPMGNGHTGVYIGEGAQDNTVEQNWIGANGFEGVSIVGLTSPEIYSDGNDVMRNRIGLDLAMNPMPNVLHGVAIGSYGDPSVSHSYVGGHARNNEVSDNDIAYNSMTGVVVQEGAGQSGNADGNTITENRIHHNGYVDPGYLGIDLFFEPGVTGNDGGDLDAGPNAQLNFPVIGSAIHAAGSTLVSGSVDVPAFPVTLEFFRAVPDATGTNHGQGAAYLGSLNVNTPTWSTSLSGALPGQLLTATTTDSFGNTSEFSLNAPVTQDGQGDHDFGDAPDQPYPTLLASNGAYHQIVPGMYLGSSVDAESDGQPDATATGDDLDGNDDEDGVAFPTPLVPGQSAQIDITASMAGRIDAWIDYDQGGSWGVAEQILTSAMHSGGGTQSYPFTVPSGASIGTTFVRVRYSSGGGLLPNLGAAPDGEVEDLQVTIQNDAGEQVDWGDAPDPAYPTLAVNSGPSHLIQPGVFLGAKIDSEADGQPDATATGDDLLDGSDDEDGVTFAGPFHPGQVTVCQVTASVAGYVDAWFDFDADGVFGSIASELVYSGPVNAGVNNLPVSVPASAVLGTTFSRFRFNTQAAGLPPTGQAGDGEVEDYEAELTEEEPDDFDWGDAPDPTYPTLSASGGASHGVSGIYLGHAIDYEYDGQPSPNADGDDLAGVPDDEDGVAFPTAFVSGVPTTLQVTTSGPGFLQGWIDWNADGDWLDGSEQVATDLWIPGPGTWAVTFPVPGTAGASTFARFRFSSVQGLGFAGPAPDGEVEDYPIDFDALKWLRIPEQGAEGVDVSNVDFSLGDDFLCTESGEITDIHLWGSFRGDVLPPEGPGGLIFDLQIWDDVPLGADPEANYSHPGELLWQATFDPGTYHAGNIWTVRDGEWWYDPATGEWEPAADQTIYQFDFDPDEPFVQEEGKVYWLVVKYRYEGMGEFEFGWKTTPDAWNDDAVIFDPGNAPVFWRDLFYQQPHPWQPASLNLAFALSGEEGEEMEYGDAPDVAQGSSYPTTLASNGARHGYVPSVRLGALIDAETDGQPDLTATGDDLLDGNDDEDGVVFVTSLIPGVAAAVQVTPSTAGYVNLWIDLDGNGDWAGANERIFTDHPVAAGTVNLGFVPPGTGFAGPTFARVRFSSQPLPAGVDYRGYAPDGEVEDELVTIDPAVAVDFGDAPDGPYPTTVLSNGARHLINPSMHLGASIDGEPDGQPDPNAQGDDNDGNDDEDGVLWYPMVSGAMTAIDVNASMAGVIDLWIDFDVSGSFDPGEKVLSGVPVSAGTQQLTFTVPAGAPASNTFARIRYSSAGTSLPTGQAADGEVEDHPVNVLEEGTAVFDFGDAPDPGFPTLAASGGAAHALTGPVLGVLVDAEPDGQPDPAALGDDLSPGGGVPDDEDGVTFGYALIGGQTTVVEIVASAPGAVDMWIDWNGNQSWADFGDQVLMAQPVNPGPNYVTIPVPPVVTGPVKARIRISLMGGLSYTGFAPDGEVEDHDVFLYEDGQMDFGDAPDGSVVPPGGFPTTMMDFGAAHFIDSLFMGLFVDGEIDGRPDPNALGDDLTGGPDDEDGVSFDTVWIAGTTAQITVSVNLPPSAPTADLEAWVDWDGDGTWTQADNHVLVNRPMASGANVLTVAVPASSGPAVTFACFRLFHTGTSVGYGGFVHGGEVEDYEVPIGKPIRAWISIDRSVSPAQVVLNWSAEPGATKYSVYNSTSLTGGFPGAWALQTSGLGALTWSESLAGPRKFYVVVAFP